MGLAREQVIDPVPLRGQHASGYKPSCQQCFGAEFLSRLANHPRHYWGPGAMSDAILAKADKSPSLFRRH